jgi:NRPS condensation-like uncharacterized protein
MMAMNDVIAAPTQLLTFRFKENHSVEDIHDAMRYMLTIYPKLRSVVESTVFSWRFRIFDDRDRQLEVLFNEAFRVVPNITYDSTEYIEFRRNLINEPFSPQGLPLKIRYLPDDKKPILFVSLHHMICDGMGWFHMENSLLKYLNGERPPILPLDSPNMLPGFIHKPYYTIPWQIYHSYRTIKKLVKEVEGTYIISPTNRPADFLGPTGMYQHFISHDLTALKKKSKNLGCGINTLHLTALSMACSRGPGRDKGDVIGINFSIDIRPFFDDKPPIFGNYVALFMIRVHKRYWDDPMGMMRVIQAQMDKWIGHFKKKELLLLFLIDKLYTFAGRKYYAWGVRWMKKKGLIPMTFAFSTLGSLDSLNSHGTMAQVCETLSIVPQHGLFVTSCSLEGMTNTNISYPEAEYSYEEAEAFFRAYDHALGEILAL